MWYHFDMDYKKNKSKTIILMAIIFLMKEKEYQDISISEIIDKAEISRSTFYAHFKKKDDIIVYYLEDLMSHVFHNRDEEIDKGTLTHVFEHIYEEREILKLIFDSGAYHLIKKELRKHLSLLVDSFIQQEYYGVKDIPLKLMRHQYLNDLINLIQYYTHHGEDISPLDMTTYYFRLFNNEQ